MTGSTPIRVAGTAALALAFWQCGGDSIAATPKRIDACALVPKAEMEQIVGAGFEKVDARFQEHTYSKPVNYSAGCIYGGPRPVLLWVHYPYSTKTAGITSEQLAGRITERLESEANDDPSMAELYRKAEVRPVGGLPGPAAAYELANQTMFEMHARQYRIGITTLSLEVARAVAVKVAERLP